MSFDISRLTSAVNKYLNSISDIGRAATQQSQEMADRAQFAVDLKDAIQQNMQSKMRDIDEIPDIGAMVQNEVQSATSGIDATFEQVRGAFLEISEAGKVASTGTDNVVKESAAAESGAGDNSGAAGTAAKAFGTVAKTTGNADAYAGKLSTEALQDLSKSQYFSANLIQGSLFADGSDQTKSSTNNSNNAFSSLSLDELNTNSLLANALGSSGTTSALAASGVDIGALTDAISSLTNGTATNAATTNAANTASTSTSNDFAKALIKAYTTDAKSTATTSIFGDFTL